MSLVAWKRWPMEGLEVLAGAVLPAAPHSLVVMKGCWWSGRVRKGWGQTP